MKNWFVKNEGQPELKHWVESREDLDTDYLPVLDFGFVVSDGYADMSYQNWTEDYENGVKTLTLLGYTEITFEEFLKKKK